MNTDEHRLNHLTEQVIGCAFRVANTLGSGCLEKVYENALALEVRKAGLSVAQQHLLPVRYDGELVGEYVADMVVGGQLLIELKAVRALDDVHMAQCINYLRASGLTLCLLLNFGTPRVEVKRIRAD